MQNNTKVTFVWTFHSQIVGFPAKTLEWAGMLPFLDIVLSFYYY